MEWILLKVGDVMVGGIIVATGHKKLGIKVANTSVVTYLILQVVAGLW